MNRPAPAVPQTYVCPITRRRKQRVVQQVIKRKLTGKPQAKAEAEAIFRGGVR